MIARISAKVEKALRETMEGVPRADADQILAPLAALTDAERVEAVALSAIVTCYVAVDACGSQWPDDGDIRQIADDLANTGTTAKRLQLHAEEIHEYLSRTALGSESLDDVIPDRERAECLAVVVAQRAIGVYSPKGGSMWDYLDQIEAAIEVASALDATVLPAAVMRAYLPKPKAEGS
jgi:hypothetical protein